MKMMNPEQQARSFELKRPGPGGDGWNDEDDGPRAIDKKLRIEEARTRW